MSVISAASNRIMGFNCMLSLLIYPMPGDVRREARIHCDLGGKKAKIQGKKPVFTFLNKERK